MRKLDHPPAETSRVARSAGCRVLEQVDLYDGNTAFEIDCRTHANKVRMLSALADLDAELPDVRRLAENVTAGLRTDDERATALHSYVKSRVAFVREKRETFSPTLRTLEIGQGDCDDSARALMALVRALDIPCRLETLPERATGKVPLHVAAQVQLGGAWEWLETSIDARAGEHPIRAARRLGIDTRPELGEAPGDMSLLDEATAWIWLPLTAAAVGGLWWLSRR